MKLNIIFKKVGALFSFILIGVGMTEVVLGDNTVGTLDIILGFLCLIGLRIDDIYERSRTKIYVISDSKMDEAMERGREQNERAD